MPTLKDTKVEQIFCLMKGEPGTRKSTQALSFAELGPQYWFSTDQKMNALFLPGRKWGIDFSTIEYDDYSDWQKMEQKLERLQTNASKYRGGIIVDSVTTTGDNINLQTIRLESGTTNKDGGQKGLRIGGIAVNDLSHYKAENAAFTGMLSILKDIKKAYNIPIIIIAHVVGERKKEEGAVTHASRIIITGGKSISGKFPAVADEVYHFEVQSAIDVNKPPEYVIYTVHSGADFARTALPLPMKIPIGDNPLYKTWIKPAQDELRRDLEAKPVTKL